LFSVSCLDNTDHGCYCVEEIFIKNVYDCIFAHGETDVIISESILFIQGICGAHIGGNPAIATGATVTSYITVTATPALPSAVYTTVTVQATTVVPCTDSAGAIVPSSSTTSVLNTVISVPQIGFATTGSSVGIIPVTTYNAAPTTTGAVSPVSTGFNTPGSVGGGNVTTTPRPTTATTNSANRALGAGTLGLAVMIMGVFAAL
jgi:hypothetical protein